MHEICVLCSDPGVQNALSQAIRMRGFSVGTEPDGVKMAFVVLDEQSLREHVFREKLHRLIASGAEIYCALRGEFPMTNALQFHLRNMRCAPYGELSRLISHLPLPESAPFFLVRIATGQRIPIARDGFAIGRSQEKCDWAVDDPSVSRVHAIFHFGEDGLEITDNMSMNGVFVNEIALDPGAPCPLEAEDEIEIGNEKYLLLAGNGGGSGV